MKYLFSKTYLWALLAWAISLAVYLLTLCPTTFLEDTPEFITAAVTLGIPHPSGYPLFVLLGKAFSYLPLGDVVWRINLMTAVFAALTVMLLFLVLKKMLELNVNKEKEKSIKSSSFYFFLFSFIPFITALIFAFTLTFWSQAVRAEVYSLNTFFVMLCTWLLLRWLEDKEKSQKEKSNVLISNYLNIIDKREKDNKNKYLYWFALIYGLSLTNHAMMALLAPIFVIYILLVDWRVIKDIKLIIHLLLLFLVGLAVYLFLPIRSAMLPAMDWGRAREWHGFLYHLTRKQYGDFSWNIFSNFNDLGKWQFIDSFFKELILQFTWLSIIFSIVGFVWLWFKRKKLVWLTLGVFLMNSLGIVLFRKAGFSFDNEEFYLVYYLPSYLMFAMWFGLGLYVLAKFLLVKINKIPGNTEVQKYLNTKTQKTQKPFIVLLLYCLIVLLLLFLPLTYVLNNYQTNNLSDFNFLDNYGYQVLNSLAPQAILIVFNEYPGLDNQIFSLAYWQIAKNLRPDVTLASVSGLFYQPTGEAMRHFMEWPTYKQQQELANYVWEYYHQNYPVYTLYPLGGTAEEKGLFTRSNGIVYRVYQNVAEAKQAKIESPILYLTDEENPKILDNHTGIDLLGDIYYARAAYYLENSTPHNKYFDYSQKLFIEGFNLDYMPFAATTHTYIVHREKWLGH